jgi:chromosome segregation protein
MDTSISKITLQGFKSFNKKISIPFLKNGFNIICGPNGVGKSNVVDAVCFVLGRASAKSLRADRLPELIFHGSKGKKPANYTSVTLYLDNSKKGFQFDEPEVFVTRKVNRRGVSVYKINGRTTTREKVLELLSSARIYPEGHNIVLQGDVTNIIEMSPRERRLIIDEISGIAEYNDKKERAERDLQKVDEKLKEAEIIISQRYEIFRKLEEDRNAALRYQELQKRLTVLKASHAFKKLKKSEEKLNKIKDEELAIRENIGKINHTIEGVEDDLERREAEIREIADKLLDVSRKVKIEKEVSELRSKILVNKDKIDSNQRETERLDSLIEKLEALETKVEGVPRAVQSILDLKLPGVHGTVASLISIPEEYRVAVEVAAGSHLYNIVVKDDDVASRCIDYLKKEKIGRATFLPLNKIKPILFKDNELLKESGVINVVSKIIKYETKFMSAIEFVFGNTLIVKDLDSARSLGIGKARMVTLEGDLIERSGAMIGGHYIRKHPKAIESSKKEEIDRYLNLKKELEKEIQSLKAELETLQNRLKELGSSEATKEMIDLEKVRISSEKEIDELREKRKSLYEKKLSLQEKLNKFEIRKAKLEGELESLRIDVKQYGEIEYIDERVSTLKKHIQNASEELASIGLVNLKAIEEYDRSKTEFDEYKKKYEKILEEKKAVLQMIEEIEEKRREVFNKCLEEVSRYFSNVFLKMCGGSASLELENPLDMESGLRIQANPEGKKLLSIDSMSGGEKTLTALAFIFAIQKYKPAPFYILDEIDAALDKKNSKIVAELIGELSRKAQFIIITHNDQTIKYGDRVYGATMSQGETKILGLEMPA